MFRTVMVAVAIAIPGIAFPCANAIRRERDQIVKQLAEVEGLIDKAEYKKATTELAKVPKEISTSSLRARRDDLRALLILRYKKDGDSTSWITTHFTDRWNADKSAVRFQAWLAEAYLAEGNSEQTLELLKDLKAKDLMPDAFAYVTLAKVSSGEDRENALAECKTRAKAKSICVLPTPKS